MTATLEAPSAAASAESQADFLEVVALQARDRNSSFTQLVRELRRSGSTDAVDDPIMEDEEVDRGGEITESIAETAFEELQDRELACDASNYPFSVATESIAAADDAEGSLYVFLLLLSMFGKDAGPSTLKPAQLFEDVCLHVLEEYLGVPAGGTNSFAFGSPRRVEPKTFRAAVDRLCERLGEGGGIRNRQNIRHAKDNGIDLVAWRSFPDRRISQIVVFGQCATGTNWEKKLSEGLAVPWTSKWFHERLVFDPLSAFFVPHRVEQGEVWRDTAASAGIVFDRCRIVACASSVPKKLVDDCARWSKSVIKAVKRA